MGQFQFTGYFFPQRERGAAISRSWGLIRQMGQMLTIERGR